MTPRSSKTRISPLRASSSRTEKSWPQRTKVLIAVDSCGGNEPDRGDFYHNRWGWTYAGFPCVLGSSHVREDTSTTSDDRPRLSQFARRDGTTDPRDGLVGE